MTQSELQTFYSNRKNTFSERLTVLRKRINIVSNLRLLCALAFLILLYFGFTHHSLLMVVGVLLVAFVALVQQHTRLFDEKVHLEHLVKVNAGEEQYLGGDYTSFSPGQEFVNPQHPYTHDLDIFGEGSLFQAINRSNTISGKRKFANRLSHPVESIPAIEEYQQAVQELATHTDFRQHFQAAGMEAGEQPGDREQLLAWVKQPPFLYPKPLYRYGLVIFPATTIVLIVLAFFLPDVKPWAILCAMVQWAVLGVHIKKINAFHEYISQKKYILQKYAKLLRLMQDQKFESPLLRKLTDTAHEADVKVKDLASLVSALNARLNVMTMFVVNTVLVYDLQCVYRLERWKDINAEKLQAWLDVISEMEVVCSFGTFAYNHPNFCYPILHTKLSVEAKNLGHPLIADDERVNNDLTLGNGPEVLVVTGANMAGKSTFLRTIGVNVVLALSGAPVCATEFSCTPIHLRSGMRTADSLKDHQSYFYAELNRLKGIMDELRQDKPILILLDEILKGTNSTDKQAGSMALVKQLLPHPCLGIIATHDLALGNLEKEFPEKIKCYCFEATIENDQLSFDYKLKPGLAQKMNATFLMKKMGIIPR